ncbi:von Willebrand factor type A domain [Frankia torreyi]|uniref:von Willebrand factor type A domain n=1 Tax=Frankia torreyi TaxID=1856 RepID=A0A0D8BEQ5_9ACTN|nr:MULTISPECIES: VWA domain-containing protein [Frankia]KJE22728.1 von Willebrand factor type A domain [Frankia torreyi]KQM04677.1 von Willebrand factor type A domain [Frankia sp. CpI1-P]
MITFTCEVSQNEFLAEGSGEVHAVITVAARDEAAAAPGVVAGVVADAGPSTGRPAAAVGAGDAPGAAEVIILDCSGSMEYPQSKIIEARRAARAAIDALPDGVAFAVVEGTEQARVVYPERRELVTASAETRAAAGRAVARLRPHGGTAMGRWLRLTAQLMASRPDAIHHAILLTDGQNGESARALEAALAACEGAFQCDCRGVGADWRVDELRQISTRLLGTVSLLREPAEMADDFRALVAKALARGVADVALRVWTPKGSTTRFLRQVSPEVDDLMLRAVEVNPFTRDHPTGAWAAGTREYHLCVDVPPADVGDERLAARVSLVVGGEVVTQARVRAVWTEDAELSTRIDGVVAHYTGQAELARAVQDGLAARRAGDEVSAVTLLGRAAQIAAAADDGATLDRLGKVVEIDDPVTGSVRLRRDVEKLDEMDLDAGSTLTVPAKR